MKLNPNTTQGKREVRFRVWDKEDKEMREVAMLRWENGEMIRIAGYWKGTRNNGWTDDAPNGRYELTQCTGLKDKNGKEIYEGDILKLFHHYDTYGKKSVDEYLILEVVWRNGGFEIGGGYIFCQDGADTWEVIGNVYENPELLKG